MTGAGLDPGILRSDLGPSTFVRELRVLDEVDSTNDEVRRQATNGAPEGTVVVAERQRAGRGRQGRRWHSPAGLGLYVSVLFRPDAGADPLTRWTLGASVAACAACHEAGVADVRIKWPNDLLFRGRKLGGILTEVRTTGEASAELIVGLGVNVGHGVEDFPDELSSSATSLRLAGGPSIPSRERIASFYLRELGSIAQGLRCEWWSRIAARWERMAEGARDQRVRVIDPTSAEGSYTGCTRGLAPDGGLRVRRDDGGVAVVRLAESVRPLEEGSCS